MDKRSRAFIALLCIDVLTMVLLVLLTQFCGFMSKGLIQSDSSVEYFSASLARNFFLLWFLERLALILLPILSILFTVAVSKCCRNFKRAVVVEICNALIFCGVGLVIYFMLYSFNQVTIFQLFPYEAYAFPMNIINLTITAVLIVLFFMLRTRDKN